ncbi:MAG TPA: bifunctional precorrin-2 dehydrogenase/sirohydrochlorin ferrochelatase [Acidimicrobiales bacterium]|jgi:siroheme synthase-like protein
MAEQPAPLVPHALFPVALDVAGKPCLVVGGGPVARRKVESLLRCGARVTVIASEVCAELATLAPLSFESRPYQSGDVGGFRLVITATGRPDVDGAVAAEAERAGIWVNSADDLEHCSFTLPAVHRDGPVTVAVSTDGASPALASWLRDRLGGQIIGAGALAELLAGARRRLKDAGVSTELVDWVTLLDGPLPSLVAEGRMAEAQALLEIGLLPHVERGNLE